MPANDTTRHALEDMKNISSAGENGEGGNAKSEDENNFGVASSNITSSDEAALNANIATVQKRTLSTTMLDAVGSTTNSAPLAKFENLETALTTTLGTQGFYATVPHVVNPAHSNYRISNVSNTDFQQSDLTQVSSLDGIHKPQQPYLMMPEVPKTAVFHVGTPPPTHFSDSASQTELISTRDPLDHMFSPTTSYNSDYDFQVFLNFQKIMVNLKKKFHFDLLFILSSLIIVRRHR